MAPKKGYKSLRKGRVSLDNQFYLVTFTTHSRKKLFLDFQLACEMSRVLNNPEVTRCSQIYTWVVMPDHVHLLVQLGADQKLGQLLRNIKSNFTRSISDTHKPVWANGFHDHGIRSDEDLKNVARYIIRNPIRAGLVKRASNYSFWDAVWIEKE